MRKAGVVCLLICSVVILFFTVAKEPSASAANSLRITNFYGEIEAYDESGEQIQHSCLQQNPINLDGFSNFMEVVRVVLRPRQGKYYEYSLNEDQTDFILITQTPTVINNVEYLTVREAAVCVITFCYPIGDANQEVTETVAKNGKVTKPQNPTAANSGEFLGWQEAGKAGLFDFETPINKDYTLYPVFFIPPQDSDGMTAYTVTFYLGDGECIGGSITQTVPHGGQALPPDVQPPAGYTFDGWDKDLQGITKDTVINAIYKAKQYEVRFDLGIGECIGGSIAQTVPHGGQALPPDVQPPAGYTFAGWDKDWQSITADTSIKAEYRAVVCRVEFYIEDNIFYTAELDFASSLLAPSQQAAADRIPTGKYLDYWSTDGATPYSFGIIEAAELRLYAVLGTHSYKVYFDLGEGSTQSDISTIEQTILYGQDAYPPLPVPPEGHIFVGWDKLYSNITANITVTAIYQKISCQVSFYCGSEALCSFTIDYGGIIKEPSASTVGIELPQGYYLEGWTADGSTLYNFSVGIGSSVRLEAVLKKYKYEIRFFDGGKQLLGDEYVIVVEYGDCLVGLLPQAPAKEKAVFECWQTSPASDRPYNSQLPITAPLNLYAKYKALSYTVYTQMSDGIAVQTSCQYAQEGQEISFSYTLPEGYTLASITLCWQQNEQTVAGGSFVMPPSDVTLKLELNPQKYDVLIITDGGAVNIPYGETYTPPPPQPPAHYVFEGWYTDSDCSSSFCGSCKADYGESVRLYPKFAKISYNITFVYGYGGTVSQTQSIEYGGYPTPPILQQTDYLVFLEWDIPLTQSEEDTVYKAVYKILFDICYYADETLLLTTRAELGKPPGDIAPLKEGYDFVGFAIEDMDAAAHTARYKAVYTKQHPEPTPSPEENNLPESGQQVPQTYPKDTQSNIFTSDKWQLVLLLICGFAGIKLISDYITKKKSSIIILP